MWKNSGFNPGYEEIGFQNNNDFEYEQRDQIGESETNFPLKPNTFTTDSNIASLFSIVTGESFVDVDFSGS